MWILSHGGKKMIEIGEENTKWTASKEKWIGWVVFDVAANLILSTLGSCCNDKHYFQKVPGGHQEHARCIGRNGHSEAPCWRLHMRILTIICRSIAISFILDFFFFLYRLSTCLHVQSCPTLCYPMDCCLPDSSSHGILQAKILELVAISFSKGSSRPKDQTYISCISCCCC